LYRGILYGPRPTVEKGEGVWTERPGGGEGGRNRGRGGGGLWLFQKRTRSVAKIVYAKTYFQGRILVRPREKGWIEQKKKTFSGSRRAGKKVARIQSREGILLP